MKVLLPRKHTKNIAISAVLLLLLTLGALVVTKTLISNRVQAVQDARNDIATRADARKHLLTLSNLLTDTQEERITLGQYVIADSGVADFIFDIEELASLTSVTAEITSVDIAVPEMGNIEDEGEPDLLRGVRTLEWLELALRTSGSWQNIMGFVDLIENMPLFLEVEVVRLARDESSEDSVGWTATMNLRALKHTVTP